MSEMLGAVRIVDLKPGDIAVVELDWRPTQTEVARLTGQWQGVIDRAEVTFDVPLVILGQGRMAIVRPAEEG